MAWAFWKEDKANMGRPAIKSSVDCFRRFKTAYFYIKNHGVSVAHIAVLLKLIRGFLA